MRVKLSDSDNANNEINFRKWIFDTSYSLFMLLMFYIHYNDRHILYFEIPVSHSRDGQLPINMQQLNRRSNSHRNTKIFQTTAKLTILPVNPSL